MATSKGSKGRRQPRRREAKEAQEGARLTQKPLKTKCKGKSNNLPIPGTTKEDFKYISSDNEIECLDNNQIKRIDHNDEIQCSTVDNKEIDADHDDETQFLMPDNKEINVFNLNNLHPNELSQPEVNVFERYNEEVKEINQANDLVKYVPAAIDDDTSNDKNLEANEESIQKMWGSLFGAPLPIKIKPHRILKSGKSHYQQPVQNPNPSSQKLVPPALPRQTKHNCKKRKIEALGRNSNVMKRYLIQNLSKPSIDPNLQHAALETTSNQPSNPNPKDVDTVVLCLTDLQKAYLEAPKSPIAKEQSKKSQERWDKLNTAITTVKALLKGKAKKDKKFQFPKSMLKNLKEFNSLRFKFTVSGSESPSKAAALATAQSSIRQHSASSQPHHKRSGIYLARSIAKKARHVFSHRELLVINHGN
jgi:hypothetical protein